MVVKGTKPKAVKTKKPNAQVASSGNDNGGNDGVREKGALVDPSTNKSKHVKVDRLKEDPPLPGQDYVCISFLSPEKVLVNKEQWFFYHYHQHVIQEYNRILTEFLGKILDSTDDDTVPLTSVVDLQKRMRRVFKYNEVVYPEWKERYADYEFKDGSRLQNEFDAQNNYQTSVRGVKVRGVFNNLEEARTRATALQRMDTAHDVFVGQVGYWLSWHPESNKMDTNKVQYLNDDLNTLMSEYQHSQDSSKQHFDEQRQSQVEQQMRQNELTKKQLDAEKREIREAISETSRAANLDVDDSEGTSVGNGVYNDAVGDDPSLPSANPDLDDKLKYAASTLERETLKAQVAERVAETARNSQLANALAGPGGDSDPWMARKK